MKTARQEYRAGKTFCFFNCLLDGSHTKYWGFRHREHIVLRVMGTLFLCSRERVKKQGRGYDYTILGKTRKRF